MSYKSFRYIKKKNKNSSVRFNLKKNCIIKYVFEISL